MPPCSPLFYLNLGIFRQPKVRQGEFERGGRAGFLTAEVYRRVEVENHFAKRRV